MSDLSKREMTYVGKQKRWIKKFNNKLYTVSLRALGCKYTGKDAEDALNSLDAANKWWAAKELELTLQPNPEEAQQDTSAAKWKTYSFMQDFDKLPLEEKRIMIEALNKNAKVHGAVEQDTTNGSATVEEMLEAWYKVLQASSVAGQLSVPRLDAYRRHVKIFVQWIGPKEAVKTITAEKLEDFHGELASRISVEAYGHDYANSILTAVKQWVAWLAERGRIALPGNLKGKRLRFKTQTKPIITFTVEEIRAQFARATDKMKCWLLVAINCGCYQNDLAELEDHEVNLTEGTITRPRSKTPDGPRVTYKLWPETIAALRRQKTKFTVKGQRGGNLWFTTSTGKPIVAYFMSEGKMKRYDTVDTSWKRLNRWTKNKKPFKTLRKTSATLLGEHTQYKFYGQYFLAQAPGSVAEKHYQKPSDEEFFQACLWLRGKIFGETTQPQFTEDELRKAAQEAEELEDE
jgi:integrase